MQTVSKSELQKWINDKQDMLLINVLPQEAFRKQSIPGSVNVPFKDNATFVGDVERYAGSRKDKKIVVYCASTQCDASEQAAQKLTASGFTNVLTFKEGVEGWFGKSGSQAAA